MNHNRILKLLIVIGILTEVFYIAFVFVNGSGGNIPVYMFIYFEAFILLFAAWFALKKSDKNTSIKNNLFDRYLKKIFTVNDEQLNGIKLPVIIILFGILFRITLIPSPPATSPDVYRYMWEGKTTVNGFNPYIDRPDDKKLEYLRDDIYNKITFRYMPSIYPPLAQVCFAVSQLITPGSFISLKIMYLLCEIMTLVFLLKLLLLKGKNPNLILFYAWLPLPVMEFFVNGHLEPIGITFLILFLYMLEKGKTIPAAIPFALSFLAKLYPLMLLPLFIKKMGIKKLIPFLLIFTAITLIFYFPFIYKNIFVIESLLKYLEHWEFNASVYNLIKLFSNGRIAREICGILLILSITIISFRYVDFTKAVFAVFLWYVIFATTVYPWYLGWIASLNPVAGFVSVTSLFFTSNFSNFTPLGKVWREYLWVLLIQYIPFFAFLIYDVIKNYSTSHGSRRARRAGHLTD